MSEAILAFLSKVTREALHAKIYHKEIPVSPEERAQIFGNDCASSVEVVKEFRRLASKIVAVEPHKLKLPEVNDGPWLTRLWTYVEASTTHKALVGWGNRLFGVEALLRTSGQTDTRTAALLIDVRFMQFGVAPSLGDFHRIFEMESNRALRESDANFFRKVASAMEVRKTDVAIDRTELMLLRDWAVDENTALVMFTDSALKDYFEMIGFGRPTLDAIRKKRQRLGLRRIAEPTIRSVRMTSGGIVGE